MKLYFYQAPVNGNVYDMKVFYNINTSYKLNINEMLSVNFKQDEVDSGTIINKTLPNGVNVKNYTHVLVYEADTFYKITRLDYVNTSQYRMFLQEDPLISKYHLLRGKDFVLQRTNDTNHFKGIHDVTELGVKENLNVEGVGILHTGNWLVVNIQIDLGSVKTIDGFDYFKLFDGNQRIKKNFYAKLDDLDTVKNYYPEVAVVDPTTVPYFNKTVEGGPYNYISIYDGSHIRWVKEARLEEDGRLFREIYMWGEQFKKDELGAYSFQSGGLADQPSYTLAFPISDRITSLPVTGWSGDSITWGDFLPAALANNFAENIKIISMKILPDYLIFGENVDTTVLYKDDVYYKTQLKLTSTLQKLDLLSKQPNDEVYNLVANVVLINNQTTKFTKIIQKTSLFEYEPFVNHSLSVFGQEYVIPARYDSVSIRFSITNGPIGYKIYGSNEQDVLGSGTLTNDIRWSTDALTLFNQENPTYKDQFQAQQLQKGINAALGVGVTVAGVASGNPLAAIGGTAGAVKSISDLAFSAHNERLREKGLRLKPDQVFGNLSDVSLQLMLMNGVFFIKKSTDMIDEMKAEYYVKGFPTNVITNINSLQFANNLVYGRCKLIQGMLFDTIGNNQTTNFIRQKIEEGIILQE